MPTKKDSSTPVNNEKFHPAVTGKMSFHFLSELARFSTWLSSAMIVAMTFLLLAGLRTPKLPLLISLYVTLGAFGLSLLSYLVSGWFMSQLFDQEDPSEADKAKTQARLRKLRMAQQLFFLVGLISLAVFVAEVSLLFFPSSSSASAAPATQ